MAKTNLLIDPRDATSIFVNTQPIEMPKELSRNGVRILMRVDTASGKTYLIANDTVNDDKFPPREFESLDAAHVFIRLTEGDP